MAVYWRHMHKKTLIVGFSALMASVAIMPSLALAQVPAPTCVPVEGIPCPGTTPAKTTKGPAFTSPKEACQWYANRPEKGLFQVVRDTAEECLVKVGDGNIGYGYVRGYYSGSKFCLASTGDYFGKNGAGDSTSCLTVSNPGKSVTTANLPDLPQLNEAKKNASAALDQLRLMADRAENYLRFLYTTTKEWLRELFGVTEPVKTDTKV